MTKAEEPSFEERFEGLKEAVRKLEQDDLSLEASLAEFERGLGLLRSCFGFVEEAERKVEVLTREQGGGIERRPLDDLPSEAGAGPALPA